MGAQKLFISLTLTVLLFTQGLIDLYAKIPKATQKDIVKVFASSEKDQNYADNAFDGDFTTRWESEHGVDPSWIAIKLKKKRKIEAIKIRWELAAARVYQIEISDNGKKWKKVARIEDGQNGELRLIKFKKPVVTRYLRIFGEVRTLECGYSIWEVELNPIILDEKDKVKIINAESSSVQTRDVPPDMDFSATMAIDGNNNTRWSSEWEDPQWIIVELDKKRKIRAVKINWETASAKVYTIQVSNDKENWKEVARIENGQSNEDRIISFKPVKAKYVRIYGEERNGNWGYSIWEIVVYK